MRDVLAFPAAPPAPGFAAIAPALIAWGDAAWLSAWLAMTCGVEGVEIFSVPGETMAWLDSHPFIGGHEARIRESGIALDPAALAAA